MPLVLDATVGGANANAYLDAVAAQTILDGVPNADAWTNAIAATRDQALVYATQLLEAIAYKGVKTTAGQALQWPRGAVIDPDYGSGSGFAGFIIAGGQFGQYLDLNAIPRRLKRGCTMLALEILRAGASDVWGVDPTINVAKKQVDVLITEFIDVRLRRVGLRVFPSVWREIFPLTQASQPAVAERG